MVEMRVRFRKVGGSLMAVIPKEIVDYKQLKDGSYGLLELKEDEDDGFGMFRGVGSWDKAIDRWHSKYD